MNNLEIFLSVLIVIALVGSYVVNSIDFTRFTT